MKRSVVSILILLAVFFVLAQAFAATETRESKRVDRSRPVKDGGPEAGKSTVDADSSAPGLEFLADPNAIRARVKEFKGLEKSLESINKTRLKEIRQWNRGPVETRMMLAKAVQSQVNAELAFIRKLSVEEGAKKTTAAVEGLLLDRQERFGKMVQKMDLDMKRMRRNERGYRRGGRNMPRNRYRDRDPYPQTYREQDRERDRERDRNRDWDDRRTR